MRSKIRQKHWKEKAEKKILKLEMQTFEDIIGDKKEKSIDIVAIL